MKRLLSFLTAISLVFFSPIPVYAVDTITLIASNNQLASGSSFTAIPGSETNVVLAVTAICSGSNLTTALTYGGQAMTKATSIVSATADPGTELSKWVLINPPTGSNTLTATCAGTSRLSPSSFSGVDQTTGYNTSAVNACDYADSAAHACGVTTQYDNSILTGGVISATQCTSLSVQANTSKTTPCGTQNYIGLYSSSARTPVGAHDIGVTTAQAGTFVVIELIPNGATLGGGATFNFWQFIDAFI